MVSESFTETQKLVAINNNSKEKLPLTGRNPNQLMASWIKVEEKGRWVGGGEDRKRRTGTYSKYAKTLVPLKN